MPTEIERKFLVKENIWRTFVHTLAVQGSTYCQGYIPTEGGCTVRVRIVGTLGFLTIKGPTVGYARSEFEYAIPVEHAREMLQTLCHRPLIEKIRYKVEWQGLVWEIDQFEGENQGLILAEVELTDPSQAIALPDWAGEEVSHDPRYYNSNLAKRPFTQWPDYSFGQKAEDNDQG